MVDRQVAAPLLALTAFLVALLLGPGMGLLAASSGAQAVVGGTQTPQPVPAVARVIQTVDGQLARVCTGVLVGPQWVATAGQCVVEREQPVLSPPTHLVVVLGETAVDMNGAGTGGEGHLAAAVMVPQGFDAAHPAAANDLALIRLDVPSAAKPMKPAAAPPNAGDVVSFLGWGATGAAVDAPLANTLRRGLAPVRAAAQCTTGGNMFFCEDSALGQAPCYGDVGAPVVNADGLLLGLVSGLDPTAMVPAAAARCFPVARVTNLPAYAAFVNGIINA